MKTVYTIIISLLAIFLNPKKSVATTYQYEYDHYNHQHAIQQLKTNQAIILTNGNYKVTIGNFKISDKKRQRHPLGSHAPSGLRLHLHHVLFKAIRTTFPAMPFLCFQTPQQHHTEYHNDTPSTNIRYDRFRGMSEYLNELKGSILRTSLNFPNPYSSLCNEAASIAIYMQKSWIAERYSWLYAFESNKYLLLAQRLTVFNTFPNRIIANKAVCESQMDYIKKELALTHFTMSKISSNESGGHLKVMLEARINLLNIYTAEYNPMSQNEALSRANQRHNHSEHFYNPISQMANLSGEMPTHTD